MTTRGQQKATLAAFTPWENVPSLWKPHTQPDAQEIETGDKKDPGQE